MTRQPNDIVDVFSLIVMGEPDECWPWMGTFGGRSRDKRPYYMASGKRYMAYRLVYELVHGWIDPRSSILHSCDNGGYPVGCCNPAHLRLGTTKENADDMMDRERHGLPKNVINAIRRLIDQGKTQEDIAQLYGVSRETVSAIKTGRTYKHVIEESNDAT